MKNSLILASANQGKLQEIQQVLSDSPYELFLQSHFNIISPEETGKTFVENAIIKARYACEKTNLPALADDSGLQVDALSGAPGIYSARYAGENATSAENVAKLLDALKDVPEHQRTARFYCVIVLMRQANDPMPGIYQGIWEGKILFEPRGNFGFGYDPIFYVPTHDCSAAELPADIKNKISHRGQALQQFISEIR